MNVGIYVCVILAALSSGSLSLPPQLVRAESTAHLTNSLHAPSFSQSRQVRLAPGPHHNHFHAPQHANNPLSFLGRLIHRQIPPPLIFWAVPHRFRPKKKN